MGQNDAFSSQAWFDHWDRNDRESRSGYHLTLGKLIDALDSESPRTIVSFDCGGYPGDDYSYRGYYEDLAFRWSDEPASAGELLSQCRSALGSTYRGWKGGDYTMDADAPLWVAEGERHCSGLAIVLALRQGDGLVLHTKRIHPDPIR